MGRSSAFKCLLLLLVTAITTVVVSSSEAQPQLVTIDVREAKHLLLDDHRQQRHRYLDVRTEEEFNEGHLENALNIPYMFITPKGRMKNPKFVDQVSAVCGKEDHLIVGCQSGVRSVYATNDLLDSEFKHVYNMGGGYVAWVENGFAVRTPSPPPPLHDVEL